MSAKLRNIAIVVALLGVLALSGAVFSQEAVSVGEDGMYPSLAFDGMANPHIAYFNPDNDTMYYTTWRGFGWHKVPVTVGDMVDEFLSLDLDADNSPAIAYCAEFLETTALKYAWFTGSGWASEIVDDTAVDVGQFADLKFDALGKPAIAYVDYTNRQLKYAIKENGQWMIAVVDDGMEEGDVHRYVGPYCSLAFNSENRPGIAYYDASQGFLKYAEWDGSEWITEVADDLVSTIDNKTIPVGRYCSLAYNLDDTPSISYYDDMGYLRYIEKEGINWIWVVADNGDHHGEDAGAGHDVGQYSSLAFDQNGRAVISYYDATSPTLMLATGDPFTQLTYNTLDPVPNTGATYSQDLVRGRDTSVAVNINNGAGIAYTFRDTRGGTATREVRYWPDTNLLPPDYMFEYKPETPFGEFGLPLADENHPEINFNGWRYLTLEQFSSLFSSATPLFKEGTSGNWAIGIKSENTTNPGDGLSDGSYVYGTWYTPENIIYQPNRVYRATWTVASESSVAAQFQPTFRFRFTTRHNGCSGAMFLQPSTSGNFFPNKPPLFPSIGTIDHYWTPPQYIMNDVNNDEFFEQRRGIGLACDLWDNAPGQVGGLMITRVKVSTHPQPTAGMLTTVYESGNFSDWEALTLGGATVQATRGINQLQATYQPYDGTDFRAIIWGLSFANQPSVEAGALYRAKFSLTSTYDLLPTARFRVSASGFDNVSDNQIYVDLGIGNTPALLNETFRAITVPWNPLETGNPQDMSRDIYVYFNMENIVPGDRILLAFDTYDPFGTSYGTYYLKSAILEAVDTETWLSD